MAAEVYFFLHFLAFCDKMCLIQIKPKGEMMMELIQSFSVDHTKIIPGIFTSRVDTHGDDL